MDRQTLTRVVAGLIGRRGEGTYWDFKRKHQKEKGELVHDVLCLANAEHDGPRFLVFGVKDGDFSVQSIDQDDGRRSQADIATLFRGNAWKFFQSRFPSFHLHEVEIHGAVVDVLVIEDEPKKPYYLVERYERVRAHHVYTRVCDTNTAVDAAAQPHEIERMWRERFGLDAPALEKAKRFLAETEAWWVSEEDGFACCHHKVFPEFTLRAAGSESGVDFSGPEWTRGEVRTDNNYTGSYELRYHETLLRRVHYVSFDDHKKNMVAPDWEAIGKGRIYFYSADSLQYAVQRFWSSQHGRDDSKRLSIPGDGEFAGAARARWPRGLEIPVLESGELESFFEDRLSDAIRGTDSTSDRDEQNELFLRSLLELDDWRRGRRADAALQD